MDDTCAVCAEMLEWAAYGQCGHLDVCSTCIARLRFICDDRRCCICKSESNIIFVTKALGDYTTMINDFSIFPVDPKEGQAGPYWFHEGTQAFFDDLDHYTMISAMCKLSCIVCDKKDEQSREGSKRRGKFRNTEQLKSHLFHNHKLFMCSLCLEGRKIFVCEQKLYTRAQLNQHISTGDSEVDGSERERGGFMGHPKCEFCRNPFYGDNELYTHMSTEHYTCHICQRQHPGQYDYYRNYDDLEIHFRREHFLCEDEACLAKKFVVFTTESEMKRHNAMEHVGRMSRSKRNAALQIPISFQYRRSREQDQSGRGRSFCPDYSNSQLSLAIQASLGTRATSSRAQADSDHRETSGIDTVLGLFEPLASTDSEPSSRYRQAEGQNSRNGPLEESSFPPLPAAARNSHQKPRNASVVLGRNTMAARLHRRNNVTIVNASQAQPAPSPQLTSLINDSEGLIRNTMAARFHHRNIVTVLNASQAQPAASPQPTSLIGGSSQLRPSSSIGKPATVNGLVPSNFSSSRQIRSTIADELLASFPSSSSKTSSKMVSHSASAPNLVDRGSLDPSVSNFPPVSATHSKKLTTNTQPSPKVEDVHTANKSLVQRIRADLEFNKDKYAAFKEISSEYRRGVIDTGEYFAYVHQFGLSHLILEIARLCPDAQKQKELVEAYDISLRSNGPLENSPVDNTGQLKHKKGSKKGKEKCDDDGISSSNSSLADSIINSVREMQLSCKPSEVVVLPKNGYRSAKGKSKVWVDDEQADLHSGAQPPYGSGVQNHSKPAADGSKKSLGTRGGGNKPKKRTSKFHRVPLGESSLAGVLDLLNSDPGSDPAEGQSVGNTDAPDEGLPVRRAWRDGGGQRLVANFR